MPSSSKPPLGTVIERAKQQLEHMIDLVPQVLILTDPTGIVVRTNEALLRWLKLSGYPGALGRHVKELLCGPDRPGGSPLAVFFDELFAGRGGGGPQDVRADVPGLGERPLRVTALAGRKTPGLVVIFVEDLTPLAEEAAMRLKKDKQEAAEKMTAELLHRVNHPLTIVLVRAYLLRLAVDADPVDRDELRRGIDEISRETERIAEILQRTRRIEDMEDEA